MLVAPRGGVAGHLPKISQVALYVTCVYGCVSDSTRKLCRYVFIRYWSMKLLKCLVVELNLEKMDCYVCWKSNGGIGKNLGPWTLAVGWACPWIHLSGLWQILVFTKCCWYFYLYFLFQSSIDDWTETQWREINVEQMDVQLRKFAKAGSTAIYFCNLSVSVPPLPHSSHPLGCFGGFIGHVQGECSGPCFVLEAFF